MSRLNSGTLATFALQCKAATWESTTVAAPIKFFLNDRELFLNDQRLLPLVVVLKPFLILGSGKLDRGPVDKVLSQIVDANTTWWKAYIPVLRFIRDEMDRLCPRVLMNTLPGTLADCSDELNALAQFACVNWKSYESCLRGDKDFVRVRELLRTEEEKEIFNKLQMSSAQKSYNLHTIEATGQQTLLAKCGVCTTFGLTAASILADKASARKVRVELVAFRGESGMAHCFVVVNRASGDLDKTGRIPTPSRGNIEAWGSHCYVVDPWAASLGSECIMLWYEYPFGGFLFRLERTWCSFESERPTAELAPKVEGSGQSCPKCKSSNLKPYSDVSIPDGFKCEDCNHKAKKSDFSVVGRVTTALECPKCTSTSIVSFNKGKDWKCGSCKHVWSKK